MNQLCEAPSQPRWSRPAPEAPRSRLAQAIDLSPTATVVLDAADGRILEASAALGRILDRDAADLVGKTPDELGFTIAPHGRVAVMRALAEGRGQGPVELALPRGESDVAFVRVEWHPLGADAIAAFVTDITEAKATEIELRSSDQRFQRFFRSAPVAVAISRVNDCRIVEVNDAWIRLFGFLREDVLGKTALELGLWQDIAERERLIAMRRSGKLVRGQEVRLRRATGQLIDALVSAELIEVHHEWCVLWTAVDVTRQRDAERELRSLNETLEERVRQRTAELEDANHELEAFLHAVSHDLRAPARRLQSFAQLLVESLGDGASEESARLVERIRASSERIGVLMDALLDLSRVGRREIGRRELDLSALAQEVLTELAASDPHYGVQACVEPGLVAAADPVLARSLLENLIGNAWKYSRHATAPRIEVGSVVHEGERVFFVRDNGCGFDMAYADRLFVPFSRLHSEREYDGTGIGLATVARIVARHGGRVWPEAAPGAGATFYFTLGPRD